MWQGPYQQPRPPWNTRPFSHEDAFVGQTHFARVHTRPYVLVLQVSIGVICALRPFVAAVMGQCCLPPAQMPSR